MRIAVGLGFRAIWPGEYVGPRFFGGGGGGVPHDRACIWGVFLAALISGSYHILLQFLSRLYMENMLMVIQQLLQLHPKPETLSRVARSAWPDIDFPYQDPGLGRQNVKIYSRGRGYMGTLL